MIIIKSLTFKEPLKDFQVDSTLTRIEKLTKKPTKHSLYHVLQENNGKEETMATKTLSVSQGTLKKK